MILSQRALRHLDVSRQKWTPHCLATIFDSQLPSPKLSPRLPLRLSLAHKRRAFCAQKNFPAVRVTATTERQKLSRGNFCPAASRCLFWPTGLGMVFFLMRSSEWVFFRSSGPLGMVSGMSRESSESVTQALVSGFGLNTSLTGIRDGSVSGPQKGPAERGHVKKVKIVKNCQKDISTLFDNFRAAPVFRPFFGGSDSELLSRCLHLRFGGAPQLLFHRTGCFVHRRRRRLGEVCFCLLGSGLWTQATGF